MLRRHTRVLYSSMHTTAGYLDQSLSARLQHDEDRLTQFIRSFRNVFPEGAAYHHDRMELRTELTEAQKEVEPRNADSHLTFIGAGLRNCVTYDARPDAPVYFIDLDGAYKGAYRTAHHRGRRLRRGARRPEDVGADSGLEASDRFGEPGRLARRPDRADQRVARRRRPRARPRRSRARAVRAQRRPDRQRIRDAADAERSRRRAEEPAALRADEGAGDARRSALDPGQDPQLRQVRRRPRDERDHGAVRPRSVVARAAGREDDGGAGAAVRPDAQGQLPGQHRRRPFLGPRPARHLPEPDSGAVAGRRTSGTPARHLDRPPLAKPANAARPLLV